MKILSKRSFSALIAGSAIVGSLALASPALAAGLGGGYGGFGHGGPGMMRPGVTGTVASISGNTLTVTTKAWPRGHATTTPTTSTTYTVDATNAKILKNGTASTLSAIAVGDVVMVQGTVSGTSVTATTIRDLPAQAGGRFGHMPGQKPNMSVASHTPPFIGNGQPIIAGHVTAVSSTTLTVTTGNNVVYSVNASSAKVTKRGVTAATISNVTVGDTVIVQGTVNGTSITASSIIDQGAPLHSAEESSESTPEPHEGFMAAVGGFFSHLFGF